MAGAADPHRLKELEQLREELHEAGSRASAGSLQQYLQLVRELRIRDSEDVAVFGSQLLTKHAGKLSEENYWLLHEQVAVAAMDVHAISAAHKLVTAVVNKYPKSARAARLKSMYHEAKGELTQAAELHRLLLEDDPQNLPAVKRQVALAKASGKPGAAIDLLRRHVDVYMTDREAWEELAELYLQGGLYVQAAHCYEELLLHSPSHTPLYVQYADIMYTLGSHQLKIARQYYAAAVEMSQGSNLRALYGLTACAAQMSGQKVRNGPDETGSAQLAAATIIRLYQEENPKMLPMVKALLASQGLQT